MTKTALITGVTGQDGAYLAKFLLGKGYNVFGFFRRLSSPNFWRLQYLDIVDDITLISGDLGDASSIYESIKFSNPDEIYHLAAQSFVGASFEQPVATADITGIAVARILEAIRHINPEIKFYQASTSELFGNSQTKYQNEKTPFNPASPYAAAKLYGYWTTTIYRKAYELFATNGILFNHESPIRGLEFVTRKISNSIAKIELGLQKELILGNIQSKRDWGHAIDYIESMWSMLQHDAPDDFVIATGETHSVQEFLSLGFDLVGKSWDDYVKSSSKYQRPLDVTYLRGDSSKAKKLLNWTPKIDFETLVKIMVEKDLDRWQRWQDGERFAWDAPNFPELKNIYSRGKK